MISNFLLMLHYALKEIIVDTFTHKRTLVNKVRKKMMISICSVAPSEPNLLRGDNSINNEK